MYACYLQCDHRLSNRVNYTFNNTQILYNVVHNCDSSCRGWLPYSNLDTYIYIILKVLRGIQFFSLYRTTCRLFPSNTHHHKFDHLQAYSLCFIITERNLKAFWNTKIIRLTRRLNCASLKLLPQRQFTTVVGKKVKKKEMIMFTKNKVREKFIFPKSAKCLI